MILEYFEKSKEFPNNIDLYIAENVVLISEFLKLRKL
jgi:hypothetical protein